MMEQWLPLGPVAIISAFNFPVAVWAWNAALALVCGDSTIWKPSEKTPLTALATQALFERAAKRFGSAPANLSQIVLGVREAGEALARDHRIPVVSATGSTAMGRALAPVVAARFGRSILELGGNNAHDRVPVREARTRRARDPVRSRRHGRPALHAACAVSSCMTASTTRSCPALKTAYARLPIGDPLADGTLVGPLIDGHAFENMERALADAKDEGGTITRRRTRAGRQISQCVLRAARHRRNAGPVGNRAPRNLRADPLCDALLAISTTRSRSTTPCRRACRPASSRRTCRKPRNSSRRRARIAASPM